MSSKNTDIGFRLPDGSKGNAEQDDVLNRPESGVFLPTTPSSTEPGSCVTTNVTGARSQLDSGYRSGLSESSAVSADTSLTNQSGVSPRMASFFLPTDHLEEADEGDIGVLLDSTDHHDTLDEELDEDDDCELSGVSVQTVCPQSTAITIPSAGSFHDSIGPALSLMGATPPRSYMTHPAATSSHGHHGTHRYSTGCLTQLSPVIVRLLEEKADSVAGQCLRRGMRVTSGRLHASNSSAELSSRRKSDALIPPVLDFIKETNGNVSPTRPMSRDRSASMPDIGAVVIQKQCAEELRKISDEFFAEIHKKGRSSFRARGRRTQAQSHPPLTETSEPEPQLPARKQSQQRRMSEGGAVGSYPGAPGQSREHSSWWWQAIIQSMAPSAVRQRNDDAVELC